MAGNDTKILTSYTSVLGDGGLNLWADPLIKAATSRSDFSVYDLRRKKTCIYLCVSPNDLEVLAPLMRLLFQQLVSILQRSLPGKDECHEVLFLLDEFKHLGKLEAIETAITTIAGYKGRFMFIIQSLSALTGTYDDAGKQNFLSNTGVQVFMATADDETPTYISKAIGEYTFKARSTSYSQASMFDHNIQISDQGAALLRPEQVRLLDDQSEIVLIKGRPPLKLRKVQYYSDRTLKRLFERQMGSLPEPAPLMLSDYSNDQVQSHLAEIANFNEDAAPRNRTVAEDHGSVKVGADIPERVMGINGDEDQADAGEIPPESVVPPELTLALAAQQQLLDQIIALQQRSRSAPAQPAK